MNQNWWYRSHVLFVLGSQCLRRVERRNLLDNTRWWRKISGTSSYLWHEEWRNNADEQVLWSKPFLTFHSWAFLMSTPVCLLENIKSTCTTKTVILLWERSRNRTTYSCCPMCFYQLFSSIRPNVITKILRLWSL